MYIIMAIFSRANSIWQYSRVWRKRACLPWFFFQNWERYRTALNAWMNHNWLVESNANRTRIATVIGPYAKLKWKWRLDWKIKITERAFFGCLIARGTAAAGDLLGQRWPTKIWEHHNLRNLCDSMLERQTYLLDKTGRRRFFRWKVVNQCNLMWRILYTASVACRLYQPKT